MKVQPTEKGEVSETNRLNARAALSARAVSTAQHSASTSSHEQSVAASASRDSCAIPCRWNSVARTMPDEDRRHYGHSLYLARDHSHLHKLGGLNAYGRALSGEHAP